MSGFIKCGIGVAALVGLLGAPVLAQTEAGRNRSGAVIAAALRLMDAAYPDVKAGTVQITGSSLTSGLIVHFSIQLASDITCCHRDRLRSRCATAASSFNARSF